MSTAHDHPDSAELSPPQDDLATRKTLGPYELKKKLGQGGMGAVYLAVDPALKRQVALKILPREKASNPQLVKRFKAEAQNASQLTHPNIVAVYGTGEADGYLYIALEFIDGIDVYDLVERRGVLPVKRSIDIIKQVAHALQHALDQGIVHRDIKPANLLVRRDGTVKLADMGLARAVDESMETGITRAGTTVGTVDYMSPEQARNSKAADVRSDIYSLGCTWYHMLTGTPPYSEGSLTNKLHAHAKQPVPDARDKNPAVPEGVVAVMQRMMAKEPDERYQTPAELIKDLEGALVNKEFVSRRILEAIDDDSVHGSESSGEHPAATATEEGEEDTYPVEMPWTDSIAEISTAPSDPSLPPRAPSTPRETSKRDGNRPGEQRGTSKKDSSQNELDEPERRPRDSGKEAPAETANRETVGRETPQHRESSPRESAPRDHTQRTVPVTDDSYESDEYDVGPRPAGNKPRPAPTTPPKAGSTSTSYEPRQSNTASQTPPPQASHKPAATSGKSATSSRPSGKTSGAAGPGRVTLPPPKRKGQDEAGDKTATPLNKQLKLIMTAAGVVVVLGGILYLAHLAQQAGEASAPPPVNPFEQAMPAPPVPVQPNAAVPGNEATAEGDKGKAKDVLIERNEELANNVAIGPGGKTGAGGSAASATQNPPGFVPDWVDHPLLTNTVLMLSVRKGPTVENERQYSSLSEAVKKVTPDGGRIILFHDGPFDLTPLEFHGGLVMIEAAQGARPQIRLVADPEHRKLPWIDMKGGTLVLDGVDLIGDAAAIPAADPWSWVRVTNGHLHIKRSSLTLTGKRTAPTTAVKLVGPLTGKQEKDVKVPRFLLDQSVIRGETLQAIQLESPGFEGVVRNSLVVTGDAIAFSITTTDKGEAGVSRQLKFVTSTVCSRQRAFFLASPGTTNPIPTELISLETLFAAPPDTSRPILLDLEEWPANKSRADGSGPYKNLAWKADDSAVLGFNPLVKFASDEAAGVADGPAWRKLWKDNSATTTFSPLTWPTDLKGDVADAPLKTWSLKSLESLALKFPVAEKTPGCLISNVHAPDFSSKNAVATQQPQRPRKPAPFVAKTTQQVDLAKTDLGKFLNSKDWGDGTLFIASGSGQKYSSPFSVDGHKWKIQFRQTEGPPLLVSPRVAGPRSGGENAAFITINGGHLDLEQASFNYDTRDNLAFTPWFINAEGGSFALWSCRIVIPSSTGNRNRGMIRWAAPVSAEKLPADSEFASYAQITDSLLMGNGVLFSADMTRRAILLNNAALVSRQHVYELTVGMNDGKDSAACDAQNCTYLAGGTLLSIKSKAPAGSTPLPCRFFHNNCVFAAIPGDGAKASPLLMNYAGDAKPESQIFWHEESCGYAPELKAFFANGNTLPTAPLPAQDFAKEWVQRWGANRVQRPLTGADGVLFEKAMAGITATVKPENLRLHKAAKGRTWSESGGPIGVRTEALEPPSAPTKAAPGSKKAGSQGKSTAPMF